MEQIRARQEEAMFYGLEQESLRSKENTPMSVKLLSYTYQVTSNYGQSFLRPLAWLGATTLGFFLIYSVFSYFTTNQLWHFLESFQFTIEQLVRPFSAWLPNGGMSMKSLLGFNVLGVLGLQILGTIQGIISLSLMTLFILAVRRRFKLG